MHLLIYINMWNSYNWCVLCVIVAVVDIISTRPQIMKPPYASSDIFEELNSHISSRRTKRQQLLNPVTHHNRSRTRILTSGGGNFFGENQEPDIVFPDDSSDIDFDTAPRIRGAPKCADGSTFCESFESYPYGHLKDVLKQNRLYKDLFGNDEVPNNNSTITNRIGETEENFVCSSIERTIFPRVGKNKNSKWKFIINQGDADGFVQGVRIETCRSIGSACAIIGDLPNGYKTSCKQKYVYRRMLSLNDNGAPIPDSFQIPSACCCSYKRDVEFLARFAAPVTSKDNK